MSAFFLTFAAGVARPASEQAEPVRDTPQSPGSAADLPHP